jgi:hypothetical protein
MGKHFLQILMLVSVLAFAAQAQSTDCNASAASPSVMIALPSRPFTAVPSHDGCWVFVSLTGPGSGIGVLRRGGRTIELLRVAPLASAPTGIALTHDGKLLIAAASDIVIFLDVQRLISGAADPVPGSFSDGPNSESIYVNVTADDKLLFVSEEAAQSITVIDLERARASFHYNLHSAARRPSSSVQLAPSGVAVLVYRLEGRFCGMNPRSGFFAPLISWPPADPSIPNASSSPGALARHVAVLAEPFVTRLIVPRGCSVRPGDQQATLTSTTRRPRLRNASASARGRCSPPL